MASFKEKIGYGLGDMSTSMFWKIFSFYLPIFYSDVYGLPLSAAATLMLVTRIWDAVSDPMMGVIADRTNTEKGKYRPYLLWMSVPFAVAGCLLFTTPDFSMTGKIIWAYVTYILMMTVYTAINVPYSSMLAVITNDSDEKTVFSSYRMFFAYTGSFIALFAWEPLCKFFSSAHIGSSSVQVGWQHSMMVLAALCVVLFISCYRLTRERFKVEKSPASVGSDFKALLRNKPWWVLTVMALCSNLFNTIRGGTVAYYFKYYIGDGASIEMFGLSILFFAGLFLAVGEVCNMVGVVCAVPISKFLGKNKTMTLCSLALMVMSILFFYVPATSSGFLIMLLLQVLISILTGIISPLIWSMYADVADDAAERNGVISAGLIFSSGSMAQKFGGALAGWGLIVALDLFGLVPNATSQTEGALLGLRLTISILPAAIALLMAIVSLNYPLGKKMRLISLKKTTVSAIFVITALTPAMAEDAPKFANYSRYAEANKALPGDTRGRVVLMGNSITDFWPTRGSHLFETHPEIIGRGISGQTSFQFLLRFRRDVVELHPEIVVINYGTNDIAENSGPYDEETTLGNVKTMVDIARANGIKVILASCLPAEGFSWRPQITDAMSKIKSLNSKVKAYADSLNIEYANYFDALVNKEGTAMDPLYADERPAVHPNKAGYAVMERILLDAIEKVKRGRVYGQIYPERKDDIAYENELVGFRIYGPATQAAGEKAYGYDIFFKYPTGNIVLPSMYAKETDPKVWAKVDSLRKIDKRLADAYIKTFSYHIDHGHGMDCYAVGPTLGAGTAALADNNKIYYPWCYKEAEILENGPDRFSVHLTFEPRAIGRSKNVIEHRIITLDSNSHLNHTRVRYEGLEEESMIVAGFPIRDNTTPYTDPAQGILCYSDPTQGPENGRALLGIIMPGEVKTMELDGHILLARKLGVGETLEYYWGFAWDKTDIKSMEEWEEYLYSVKESINWTK